MVTVPIIPKLKCQINVKCLNVKGFSHKEKPIDEKVVLIGEVGLSREIRSVAYPEKRIEEAVKLGFTTILLSQKDAEKEKRELTEIIGLQNIRQALEHLGFCEVRESD